MRPEDSTKLKSFFEDTQPIESKEEEDKIISLLHNIQQGEQVACQPFDFSRITKSPIETQQKKEIFKLVGKTLFGFAEEKDTLGAFLEKYFDEHIEADGMEYFDLIAKMLSFIPEPQRNKESFHACVAFLEGVKEETTEKTLVETLENIKEEERVDAILNTLLITKEIKQGDYRCHYLATVAKVPNERRQEVLTTAAPSCCKN